MDELPSALMIEQAAMAMLRLPHPARRRFALLMIVATHRYQKTGPVSRSEEQIGFSILSMHRFSTDRKASLIDVVAKL